MYWNASTACFWLYSICGLCEHPMHHIPHCCQRRCSDKLSQAADLKVIEGDGGVMGEEGAELVKASEDNKGDGVVLGSHGHQVAAHRSHHAAVG